MGNVRNNTVCNLQPSLTMTFKQRIDITQQKKSTLSFNRLVMFLFVTFLYCLCINSCHAADCKCSCFSVNTIDVELKELVRASPLYSQAASNASLSRNLDSVCLDLAAARTPGAALVQTAFHYFDGKPVLYRSAVQVQDGNTTGTFLAAGPMVTYKDFILGRCKSTYVIYRCSLTGECATDPSAVDVIISSRRKVADQDSIEKGIEIAQANFPGLGFYTLPRNTRSPCSFLGFP